MSCSISDPFSYDCRGVAPTMSCISGMCVCTLGTSYPFTYREYYNRFNCFPEVGNCVIRRNPPFALGQTNSTHSTTVRSCVTKDNIKYEVHMIGIYGDEFADTYNVVIRPRGDYRKPIVLVLSSYHATYWNIDTNVHLHAIVYGNKKPVFAPPVKILEASKCGALNITKWTDLENTYGWDADPGYLDNTPKALLKVKEVFGPVTSFTGIYKLLIKRIVTLQVGGNPLEKEPPGGFQYNNTINCVKEVPTYSIPSPPVTSTSSKQTISTTKFPESSTVTSSGEMELSPTREAAVTIPVVVAVLLIGACIFFVIIYIKRKIQDEGEDTSSLNGDESRLYFTPQHSLQPVQVHDEETRALCNSDLTPRTQPTAPPILTSQNTSTGVSVSVQDSNNDVIQLSEWTQPPPSYDSLFTNTDIDNAVGTKSNS